jgi:hypothetical protein
MKDKPVSRGEKRCEAKAKARPLLILPYNLFIYVIKVLKAFVIWDNGLFSASTKH